MLSGTTEKSIAGSLGGAEPSQEAGQKRRGYLISNYHRFVEEKNGLFGSKIKHPNPLSSTPTVPVNAPEGRPVEPSAVAEPTSSATEDPTTPFSKSTTLAPKGGRKSSKTICRSLAECTAKRKARRREKIVTPLSPISEERHLPQAQSPSNEQVSRPMFRFVNHLGQALKSRDTGFVASAGSDMPRKDTVDKIEMKPGSDTIRPSPGPEIQVNVSRPSLIFTDHFCRFLDSQQSKGDSFAASQPLYYIEADQMDSDEPEIPRYSESGIDTRLSGAAVGLHHKIFRGVSGLISKESLESGMAGLGFDMKRQEEPPDSFRSKNENYAVDGISIALPEDSQVSSDHVPGDSMDIDYRVW